MKLERKKRSNSYSCHVENILQGAQVYLLGDLDSTAAKGEMNKLARQGIHCVLVITLQCFAETLSEYHIATKGIITGIITTG